MKNTVNRSSLFLTELILDLFVFIVCTAVCTGLLIKAYSMGKESTELIHAVYAAQSAAEEWKSGILDNGDWESASAFKNTGADCGKSFDKQWMPRPAQSKEEYTAIAAFTLLLHEESMENGLKTARIQVLDGNSDKEIYTLTVTMAKEVSPL